MLPFSACAVCSGCCFYAMSETPREESAIGGGGWHLAGVGMVERADAIGQRGGCCRLARLHADRYSCI